ncbi:Small auxin-up RNA [Sesbania bispinosa]|nr:Small auxin-up RNA [Sesbania bispinosa]
MAEIRVRSKKKVVGGILKLKIVLEKLQKTLLLGRNKLSSCGGTTSVPGDVKEGHFAVIAQDGEEPPKRFAVPLRSLSNTTFLTLLEQAAEEYGFDQDGALTIPCRPSELEMLLAQLWQEEGGSQTVGLSWNSCHKAMVKSY